MKKFLVWILIFSMLALGACGKGEQNEVSVDPNAPKDMTVHFINVGQGDAIFIELPSGKTMLIDSGNASAGETVTGYISGLGYTTLDYIIATHPHADHIGGMKAVFEKFEVKKIYMTSKTSEDQSYIDLLAAMEKEGLKKLPAVAGNTIKDLGDDVNGMFIAHRTLSADLNENSAVFHLTYGNRSFLFAGDAGFTEEESIRWDYKCDVLKVGNHGKANASGKDFLNNAKASIAVISCGNDNAPAQETLSRLKDAGISQVLRTDEKGTIVIKTNGDSLEVVKGN